MQFSVCKYFLAFHAKGGGCDINHKNNLERDVAHS